MTSQDSNEAAALREAATRLLARREHSRRELSRKLVQRGWSEAQAEAEIDALAALDLQSDERFAQGFARQRIEKSYGPRRIQAELAQRGIDETLARRAMAEHSPDWPGIVAAWYKRRWGDSPPADLREKSRRQQALLRRGFTYEHFRELFD
ncbi:MAG TPA: regulatory protein RecX [Wenzhouxiangella sp.]|nr:regulatory protein RecX [Wenzhouxiangella sp.]